MMMSPICPSTDPHCLDCVVSGGTLTSVCSCDVCTNEYSPGDHQTKHPPQPHPDPAHHHHHGHHQHGLVETPCDNDKCIMCTPVPLNNNNNNNNSNNNSNSKLSERASDNNNYEEENNEVEPGRPVPPPLPKKTVAPYQVTNTTTSTIAQLRKITQPTLPLLLLL